MADLPEDVVDEAVRLSRLAREAADPAEAEAYRSERERVLAEHGYVPRVRDEDVGAVLVCYPADWVVDGTVDPADIADLDRAVERRLEGADDSDEWSAVEAHNRELAAAVEGEHGAVHGATAHAFADFMSNHYARRLETAGPRACREFLEDYLPRNAWPTEDQTAVAEDSLRLVFRTAGAEPPDTIADGRSDG